MEQVRLNLIQGQERRLERGVERVQEVVVVMPAVVGIMEILVGVVVVGME